MDLILWRHAEAEPGEPDLGRRLTAKGQKQAERMGEWLDRHLPDTARILVSPADRAQQTALALKRKFRTVDEIAPGATVAAVLGAAGWPDSRETGRSSSVTSRRWARSRRSCSRARKRGGRCKKGAVWWLSNRDRTGASSVVLRVVIGAGFRLSRAAFASRERCNGYPAAVHSLAFPARAGARSADAPSASATARSTRIRART